jgi:hypothetical protein
VLLINHDKTIMSHVYIFPTMHHIPMKPQQSIFIMYLYDDAALPNPQVESPRTHRIFPLPLAQRALNNSLFYFPFEKYAPTNNFEKFPPLYFGRSHFAISRIWWSRTLFLRPPKPEFLKLRCARKVDFSTTLHSIGISDFVTSRILMRRFRDFTPRNPEMVNKIDFSIGSTPPIHPVDS